MGKYTRKTDGLDPERGDTLITRREDVAPLFAPSVDEASASRVLYAYVAWFVAERGTSEPTLADPFADAFLHVLINRQKANVARYVAQCDARSPFPTGRDKSTQGETSLLKEDNKTKRTELTPEGSVSSSRAVGGLASPPPPADSSGGVKVGEKSLPPQRVIALFAPKDYFGKIDSEDDERAMFAESFAAADDAALNYFLTFNVFLNGGDKDAIAHALTCLRSARDKIGRDLLARLLWKFDIDRASKKLPRSLLDASPEDTLKFVLARVGYVHTAKELLDYSHPKEG